jgi:hypothetical protein
MLFTPSMSPVAASRNTSALGGSTLKVFKDISGPPAEEDRTREIVLFRNHAGN